MDMNNFTWLVENCKDHIDKMSNECDANLEWMNDLNNLISLLEHFSISSVNKDEYLLVEFDTDMKLEDVNNLYNYLKQYFGDRVIMVLKQNSIKYISETKMSLINKLNNYIKELNN